MSTLEMLTDQLQTHDLPSGWRWSKLSDLLVCMESGSRPKGGAVGIDSGVRSISAEHMTPHGTFDFAVIRYVPREYYETMPRGHIRQGDILIVKDGATTGKTCFVDEFFPFREAVVNEHVFICRADVQQILPQLLFCWLWGPQGQYEIRSAYQGAAIGGINQSFAAQIRVPVPPLRQQHRITAALREQMAAVEKARAAAQARLEAVKTLPAAFLRNVFDAPETTRWTTRRLADVLVPHKEVIHPGDRESGTAEFVGLEHVEPHTGRRLGSLTLDLAHLTGRKPTFRRAQIVYGYLRPYLNKVWIAEFDGCSSVDQFAYDVRSDLADVRFVAWFMRSPTYLRRSEIVTTTGQLPRIGTEEIAAVQIELPPLEQQRAIASEIDHRFATRQRISDLLRAETDAIDNLPAALLRQAFAAKR